MIKLFKPALCIIACFVAVLLTSQLTAEQRAYHAKQQQWAYLQTAFASPILDVQAIHHPNLDIYSVSTEQEQAWLVFNQSKGFSSTLRLASLFTQHGLLQQFFIIEQQESQSYLHGISQWQQNIIAQWQNPSLNNKKEVDQLSGATITSQAIIRGIQEAEMSVKEFLQQHE